MYSQCKAAMRTYVRALATFCTVTLLGTVLVYTIFLSDGKRASIQRDHRVGFNVDHDIELQSIDLNRRLDQSDDQQREHLNQQGHLGQQEERVGQQEKHSDRQDEYLDRREEELQDQQKEYLSQQEDHLDQQEVHLDQQEVDVNVRTSTVVGVPEGAVSSSSSENVSREYLRHLTTGAQSSKQTMFQGHVQSNNVSFTVARGFTFPHPQVFKPVSTVLSSSWVRQLKLYLLSITPARQVTITVASYDFAANLLNWLISAQVITSPPLENILVVSFDEPLHRMLIHRKISSLFVPYASVLRNPHSLGVHKVWMTRMAVLRLISHWGFHVVQFDTDAIILRNPQPLFDRFPNFDIVGSRAKLPFELGKGQWGFTVCMGAILFRSTARTGRSS